MVEHTQPSILIVDDQPDVADKYKFALKEIGFKDIETQCNPEKAIESLRDRRADVVLMDIKMQSDAYGGVRASEAIQRLFDIPVVYLTAYSDPQTIAHVKESGSEVYGYAVKGTTTQALKAQIEVGIYNHSRHREQHQSLSFSFDQHRYVTFCTDLMSTMVFGKSVSDVVGSQFDEWFPPPLIDELNECFRRAVAEKSPQQYQLPPVCNGGVSVFEFTADPILLNNTVIGLQHQYSASDPSDWKRLMMFRQLFGDCTDLRAVVALEGQVSREHVDGVEDGSEVEFTQGVKKARRILSAHCLKKAGLQNGHRVKYEVFDLGDCRISKLSRVQESKEALLKKLAEGHITDAEFNDFEVIWEAK